MLGMLNNLKIFKESPNFWWDREQSITSGLLMPISYVYGWIAGNRMFAEPMVVSDIPVVCVGNYVVGGTGKTPFAMALFELFRENYFSPAFLLRGYGGAIKGPVWVNSAKHTAKDVGDEAMLLAAVGPTIVAAKREEGLEFAKEINTDILILDDGFQDPKLQKDISVVLIDAEVGIGNGNCIPAGPLRAPINKQILKTDILVVVGEGDAMEPVIRIAARRGLMPYHSSLVPKFTEGQVGTPVLAYAGIGRPEKFFDTARRVGFKVVHECTFPDHHVYSESQIEKLLELADEKSLTLLTTAKDKARLAGIASELAETLVNRSAVLEVDMQIDRHESLMGHINRILEKRLFHRG